MLTAGLAFAAESELAVRWQGIAFLCAPVAGRRRPVQGPTGGQGVRGDHHVVPRLFIQALEGQDGVDEAPAGDHQQKKMRG